MSKWHGQDTSILVWVIYQVPVKHQENFGDTGGNAKGFLQLIEGQVAFMNGEVDFHTAVNYQWEIYVDLPSWSKWFFFLA